MSQKLSSSVTKQYLVMVLEEKYRCIMPLWSSLLNRFQIDHHKGYTFSLMCRVSFLTYRPCFVIHVSFEF
jgi:hypothetical protein